MTKNFSGPALAINTFVSAKGEEEILVASGNCVYCGTDILISLNPSTIVHGIHVADLNDKPLIMAYGGKELAWTSGNLMCQDWILGVAVFGDKIFCAVMHNRVEVYSISTMSRITIVACPTHALLYSAAICAQQTVQDDGGVVEVEVVGGGVLSSLYHWKFFLPMDGGVSPEITHSKIHNIHKGSIFRIRIRGQEMLTTSDDRSVILWKKKSSTGDWENASLFSGHLARVWDATWTANNQIATACEDSLIRLFDRDTTHPLKSLSGHSKDVRCLHSTSDDLLISGGEDGCAKGWNISGTNTTERKWTLPTTITKNFYGKSDDWIRHVELLDLESLILIVTAFGHIHLLQQSSLEQVGEVPSLPSRETAPTAITCAKLIGQGNVILGSAKGEIFVFNIPSKKWVIESQKILTLRVSSILSVHSAVHGDLALIADHSGEVVLFSIEKSIEFCRFKITDRKVGKFLHALLVKEGLIIVSDDRGFVTRLTWDKIIGTPANTTTSNCLSRNEKLITIQLHDESSLAANTSEGNTIFFSIDTLERRSIVRPSKDVNFVCAVERDVEDGDISVIGFASTKFMVTVNNVIQCELECGGSRRCFDFRIKPDEYKFLYTTNSEIFFCQSEPISANVMTGCNGDLTHGVIGLGDEKLITVSEDSFVRLLDTKNGLKIIDCGLFHEGSIRAVAYIQSPDDGVAGFLMTGGARSQISIISIKENSKLSLMLTQKISDDNDVRVMSIAVASSVACIVDSMARIHLWKNGEIQSLPDVDKISTSVCLSVAASTDTFLVGAGNGYVVAVDLNGDVIDTLRVHQNGVNAIVTSSHLFVSVSDDESVSVTKIVNGKLVRISHVENASISSIRAAAVCGSIVLTTGTDRRISVWSLGLEYGDLELICFLPTAVTDPLSIAFVSESEIVVAGRGIERICLPSL